MGKGTLTEVIVSMGVETRASEGWSDFKMPGLKPACRVGVVDTDDEYVLNGMNSGVGGDYESELFWMSAGLGWEMRLLC